MSCMLAMEIHCCCITFPLVIMSYQPTDADGDHDACAIVVRLGHEILSSRHKAQRCSDLSDMFGFKIGSSI